MPPRARALPRRSSTWSEMKFTRPSKLSVREASTKATSMAETVSWWRARRIASKKERRLRVPRLLKKHNRTAIKCRTPWRSTASILNHWHRKYHKLKDSYKEQTKSLIRCPTTPTARRNCTKTREQIKLSSGRSGIRRRRIFKLLIMLSLRTHTWTWVAPINLQRKRPRKSHRNKRRWTYR